MAFSKRLPFRSESIRMITDALGIPGLNQVVPKFSTELRRARRYERPLSVLEVNAKPADGEQRDSSLIPFPPATPPTLVAFVILGSFLLKTLREDDILASTADGLRYLVILPEADELDARRALQRLSRDLPDYAALSLSAGLAVFPRDGATVEALLGHAHRSWQKGMVDGAVVTDDIEEAPARGASHA